jgi:hypothetical protein
MIRSLGWPVVQERPVSTATTLPWTELADTHPLILPRVIPDQELVAADLLDQVQQVVASPLHEHLSWPRSQWDERFHGVEVMQIQSLPSTILPMASTEPGVGYGRVCWELLDINESSPPTDGHRHPQAVSSLVTSIVVQDRAEAAIPGEPRA